MFRIPAPLIAGQSGTFVETIDTDTYIGDLYTFVGSPTGIATIDITIDGADVGEIIISNAFAPGSTFQFTCINSGRILGMGGNGGLGGADFGSTGESGSDGFAGGAALSSNGFVVNVDVDDGYLLGGGGGGGGGSYEDTGTGGNAGGGGGGGIGWTGGTGGNGGSSIGLLPAADGGDGSRSAAGIGGFQGGLDNPNSGGNGGTWGSGGQTGISWDIISGFGVGPYRGGLGGRAGAAFAPSNGASLNLNGASSEATLRSESRIKGTTSSIVPNMASLTTFVSTTAVDAVGFSFLNNGNLQRGVLASPTTLTNRWLSATSTTQAAFYQIRERANTGTITAGQDRQGTFSSQINATPGNWSSFTATQAITAPSFSPRTGGTLIEIRRNDVPGNPDDEIIQSAFITMNDEAGV